LLTLSQHFFCNSSSDFPNTFPNFTFLHTQQGSIHKRLLAAFTHAK
jgi:hypothetical protein